jgi:hypothetical protein
MCGHLQGMGESGSDLGGVVGHVPAGPDGGQPEEAAQVVLGVDDQPDGVPEAFGER